MEKKGFRIGEAFKTGWLHFKEHVGFFIGILILSGLSIIVPQLLSNVSAGIPLLRLLFLLLYLVMTIGVRMGCIRISLNLIDRKEISWKQLYGSFHLFFKLLIAEILFGLILIAGLLLLIFPFFIWLARYGLYSYVIVDQEIGPIKALKQAAKISMGAKWDLLGFYILAAVLYFLGLLALILGLFVVIPIILVANAWIYRKLLAQTKNSLVS